MAQGGRSQVVAPQDVITGAGGPEYLPGEEVAGGPCLGGFTRSSPGAAQLVQHEAHGGGVQVDRAGAYSIDVAVEQGDVGEDVGALGALGLVGSEGLRHDMPFWGWVVAPALCAPGHAKAADDGSAVVWGVVRACMRLDRRYAQG